MENGNGNEKEESLQVIHHEMRESMLLLNMIVDIFGKVVEARDLNESLDNIFVQVGQYIHFKQGIMLVKEEENEKGEGGSAFKIFGQYGLDGEVIIEKRPIAEKENSLVYCVRDIGSSIIVSDVVSDFRFDQHELFNMKDNLSVIAKCISFNNVIHAIFLFYTKEKELVFLRGSLEKLDKVMSIILPHLQVRANIERELKRLENEKDNERKWAQGLLQIVGHDICNPLIVIKGMSKLAEKNCSSCGHSERIWGAINRATETIGEIIDSVRTMQAIKMNKISLELTPTSLLDTIEKAKFVFEEKLKTKQIEIVYNSHKLGDVNLLVDKLSFSNQVINNLISNAIKFSYQNSTIQISAELISNKEVHVQIQDFGIGIPKNILENIFDARKKTTRQGTLGERGTGFGMPLVKNFIDLYGGHILIESKDVAEYPNDHGSIIHIYVKKA